MKLFTYLAAFATTNALECFSCAGRSYQKCIDNGDYQTCLDNEEVCQVHQRKRDGEVYRVCSSTQIQIFNTHDLGTNGM